MTRVRFATQVDHATQARVRATIRGVQAATGRATTLAEFTETALAQLCYELEDNYNNGARWPVSDEPLQTGPRASP